MFAELQGALHPLVRLDSLIGNYLGRVRRRILLRRRGYRRVVTSAKVNRLFLAMPGLLPIRNPGFNFSVAIISPL